LLETTSTAERRVSRNTAKGRRIADVYHAYLEALGNRTDAIAQANVLTAAELKSPPRKRANSCWATFERAVGRF